MRVVVLLDFLLRPVIWLLRKSRTVRIYFRAWLPRSARVLDVGSGHNPWFRSNVLFEKFPDDHTEREGPLQHGGREVVFGDAERMPFPDKSFDFVYCSHVAEHVDDIGAFFREVQRVGKAGFIETPNALFEQSVGTTTHLWALWVENGVLHAERKWVAGAPARAYHGMHCAISGHPLTELAWHLVPELKVMQFWWKDRFEFQLHEAPEPMGATRSSLTPADLPKDASPAQP